MSTLVAKSKVTELALAMVKFLAITISFGLLYFLMNEMNPALAKSITGPFEVTFRFAQVLKSFTLWLGPAVPIGTYFGSQAFNGSVGDFSFVPMVNMLIGIGAYFVSKTIGRSTKKDLTVLFFYGLLTGLVVSAKLSGVAMAVDSETWASLLKAAVAIKVATSTGMYLLGYPIARAFENAISTPSE